MGDYRIDDKDIEEFSLYLKEILTMELNAVNKVFETWRGWPYNGIVISLTYPFKTKPQFLPESIHFRELNDIKKWKSEYKNSSNGDMLICKFGI